MSSKARAVLFVAILVSGLVVPGGVAAAGSDPVCISGSDSTNEDTALNGTVVGLCSDADSDPLTYAPVTGPSNGSLVLNPSGTFTYTPDANWNGSDSFTFKANDGDLDSAPVTFDITVDPVNDPPTCTPVSVTTPEDTQGSTSPDCADVDGDSLTYAVNGATHGTPSVVGGMIVYEPAAGYNGSDSFDYGARDPSNKFSGWTAVSVTVTGVNDPPTCQPEPASGPEDVAIHGTVSCTDPDGDPLTYSKVADPDQWQRGLQRRELHLHAGRELPRLGHLHVQGERRQPRLAHRHGHDHGDLGQRRADLLPRLEFGSRGHRDHRERELQRHRRRPADLRRRPRRRPRERGLRRQWSELHVHPGRELPGGRHLHLPGLRRRGELQPATVTITVNAVNDPPVCAADTASGNEDQAIHGTVSCTDPDGDPLTYSKVADPSHGSVVFSGANYTYTPDANYHGSDSFTFRANDGLAVSNLATATITVTSVNDAPVAVAESYSVAEDGGP